jgi:hypothetical protein
MTDIKKPKLDVGLISFFKSNEAQISKNGAFIVNMCEGSGQTCVGPSGCQGSGCHADDGKTCDSGTHSSAKIGFPSFTPK